MAAEEVLDAVEEVAEVLPTNPKKILVGLLFTAVGSAALGGVAGWLLAEKKLKKQYDARVALEIEEAKEYYKNFYKTLHKKDDYETPQGAAEALVPPSVAAAAEAMVSYQGGAEAAEEDGASEPEVSVEIEAETVNVTQNIFEQQKSHSELSPEEKEARSPQVPYIIDYEEYMSSESDYQQTHLTYYEGDDVLTDDTDEPIPELERTVGRENLRFGHASGDVGTVFIRNDRLERDFEVTRSDGSFAHEVLGFQHSDQLGSRQRDRHERRNQNRKFRGGDE